MTMFQIKSDIHSMIEKIEQEQYLLDIHHSLASLLETSDVMDILTESQKQNLNISLQQAQSGNVKSFQNLKEKYNQRFTK
jgi:2-oxo-4-hydroxy-4-carboxy--5-ureidoimidazoline (OHCU) decarboxylase